MNDERLKAEINGLERKVRILVSEHTKLKEELLMYKRETERLRALNSEQSTKLAHFQNKLKITKIVENTLAGDEKTAELKAVLDQYINEIDKCIAHLGEA